MQGKAAKLLGLIQAAATYRTSGIFMRLLLMWDLAKKKKHKSVQSENKHTNSFIQYKYSVKHEDLWFFSTQLRG